MTSCYSDYKDVKGRPMLKFGELQGTAPGGIKAYSNKSDMHFSGARNYDEGMYTGFQFQCVEYSRRWLLERKGIFLPDIPWAAHIFEMKEMEVAETGEKVPVIPVRNGTKAKPELDTLLIYPSAEDNAVGHVACITEVGDGWIRIADQNQRFHKWEGDYSAQLDVIYNEVEGTYTVQDRDTDDESVILIPLGWVTFPGIPNRDTSKQLKVHEKYHAHKAEPMQLDRATFVPEQETKANWLDISRPCLKKFVETFGMDLSRKRLAEQEVNYYKGNIELWFTCIQAGNQLHEIFLRETAKVIESDEKLRLFGIPEVFWGRVRRSWETQKKCLTGRFDFAVGSDGQMKCYEYNADSASTLVEMGIVQQCFAEAVGISEGSRGGGMRTESLLDHAWRKSGVKGFVHFCVDDDDEEQYTAMYVAERAEAVGLKTKLYVGLDEFSFDDEGRVVDKEGQQVRTIWKTWAWESAFSDFLAAQKERGEDYKPKKGDKVRLCDLLLAPEDDSNIVIFEPLWKVIPSNKAILPMLYESNPENRFLLPASYTLTPELEKTGYAKKPIVGRTGANVTISKEGKTLEESKGKFSERDMVYQQLFELPKRDGYHAIIGGWMIGDEYGGTGIREDKSIITNVDSPFSCIRFLVNFQPKKVTHESLDAEEEDERRKKEEEGGGAVTEEASPTNLTSRHR